jgi:hypothetical protein
MACHVVTTPVLARKVLHVMKSSQSSPVTSLSYLIQPREAATKNQVSQAELRIPLNYSTR